MGYVDVAGVAHTLPDGRELFADVSFRVGEGAKVALVGPNGAGKTTLLRMVAGDLPVGVGGIARSGGLGVMRQLIGMIGDGTTLRELALSLAAPAVRAAGDRLARAEAALHLGHHFVEPRLGLDHLAVAAAQAGQSPQERLVHRLVHAEGEDTYAVEPAAEGAQELVLVADLPVRHQYQ